MPRNGCGRGASTAPALWHKLGAGTRDASACAGQNTARAVVFALPRWAGARETSPKEDHSRHVAKVLTQHKTQESKPHLPKSSLPGHTRQSLLVQWVLGKRPSQPLKDALDKLMSVSVPSLTTTQLKVKMQGVSRSGELRKLRPLL